jgi:cytochrome P450
LSTSGWLALAAFVAAVVVFVRHSSSRTSKLRGPPRGSIFFGQSNNLLKAECENDSAPLIQEGWAEKYGSIYKQPLPFGMNAIALTDPKAITHFYTSTESTYVSMPFARRLLRDILGEGIISAEGEDHKRQRRAMTSGFTNAKFREFTHLFLDAAHKVKASWEQQLEGKESADINVAPWMNAISLDSIGAAGFAHEFGATTGKTSRVGKAVGAFTDMEMSVPALLITLLQPVIPFITAIPTERTRGSTEIKDAMGTLAAGILQETKNAEAEGDKADEKSVLGLLIKAQSTATGFRMNEEEVNALMRTIMLAGYETTSISMTWAFIELAKRPDLQNKLRAELIDSFPNSDPTWDQLSQGLPLLDAVVHETLRLHPAVIETVRQAGKDDIIPLSQPLTLADGTVTDQIFVEAGSIVSVPIAAVHRLRSLWGEDAHEFKPERWLNNGEGIGAGAKELQGHRHLLTFTNGPRTCLGKGFALAEFKASFAVLVKHFSFELPGGVDAKVGKAIALTPRPTIVGEPRCHVTMRIRRVD